jgi:hypothetical protein
MKTCSETEQVKTKKQKDLAILNTKNKTGDISKIVSNHAIYLTSCRCVFNHDLRSLHVDFLFL